MARASLTDDAIADVKVLASSEDEDDRKAAVAALAVARSLQENPYLGDPLREKSNQRPLAQADCRKVKFDGPDRKDTAKPRYRYRLVYRIEPHDGSPETVVVMAVGAKPGVYGDATARAASRLRGQAAARVRRTGRLGP